MIASKLPIKIAAGYDQTLAVEQYICLIAEEYLLKATTFIEEVAENVYYILHVDLHGNSEHVIEYVEVLKKFFPID